MKGRLWELFMTCTKQKPHIGEKRANTEFNVLIFCLITYQTRIPDFALITDQFPNSITKLMLKLQLVKFLAGSFFQCYSIIFFSYDAVYMLIDK